MGAAKGIRNTRKWMRQWMNTGCRNVAERNGWPFLRKEKRGGEGKKNGKILGNRENEWAR
jgi:hypothetical protein